MPSTRRCVARPLPPSNLPHAIRDRCEMSFFNLNCPQFIVPLERKTGQGFPLRSEPWPRAISWKTLLACIAGCGPRIGNGACGRCGRGNIAKGVDQVPQLIGDAILLQIRNVVTGVMDIPLFEPAPKILS
jgi:hypothetical protein